MNKTLTHKTLTHKTPIIIAALLALPLVHAATMTRSDYQAAKTHISVDYTADKAACGAFSGNAKDICVEQAKAKENVARAELEYGYTAKPADQAKILVVRAEADYAVAEKVCNDKAGNSKNVCVMQARAVEVKALADAKMGRQIGEARTDAADAKRDADYKVATEKCEAFAGDAKSACIESAKLQFGKT